tara:strand:- start:244 stop:450 length:207 start_codon:yes stop_codon:yes gene_type:complete
MTPKKAFRVRRVHILLGVRVPVMSTMVGGPPEGTALSGTACDKSTDKLNNPGSFKGPVRKIAVIKCGD